jgi:hypothetical protein
LITAKLETLTAAADWNLDPYLVVKRGSELLRQFGLVFLFTYFVTGLHLLAPAAAYCFVFAMQLQGAKACIQKVTSTTYVDVLARQFGDCNNRTFLGHITKTQLTHLVKHFSKENPP